MNEQDVILTIAGVLFCLGAVSGVQLLAETHTDWKERRSNRGRHRLGR